MADPTHTLVLGGGGVTGIAWITGLLAGLDAAGLDAWHAASVLGTSAGSTVAAQVTSGRSMQELYAGQLAGVPYEITKNAGVFTPRYILWELFSTSRERAAQKIGRAAVAAKTGPLAERRGVIEARLPNHEWSDADLHVIAVDAATGVARDFTRADGVDLVDAVAASCAVPLVWPAVPIGGSMYIDGGMRSTVNLDLAPGTGPVLAIAPTTASVRKWASITAQREALGSRKVEIVSPSAAVKEAQGKNPLDTSVVPAVARAGFEQASAELPRLQALLA